MRISDCSSDVCSSDLHVGRAVGERTDARGPAQFDAGKGSCLRVAAGRRRCAHERAPARTTGATLGGTGKLETILSPVTARPSPKNSRRARFNTPKSEERSVGKEGVRTCRSRGSANTKTKINEQK